MNQIEQSQFVLGVSLAQDGNKKEAYSTLKGLLFTVRDDANLFLWIAFTTPDINEAEKAIRRANEIDPNDKNVSLAKGWLVEQKAKTLPPPPSHPTVEVIDTPVTSNYNQQNTNYQSNYSSQPLPNTTGLGSYNYGQPQQPPVMVFPQTIYMQPQAPVITKNNHDWFYLIPLVGIIGSIVSIFLSWVTIGFTTGLVSLDVSFNGFGGASGSSALVGALSNTNLSRLTDKMHGSILLGMLALITAFLITSYFYRNVAFPAISFFLAFICGGLLILDYSNLQELVGNFNANYSNSLSNTPAGSQLGTGLIVGLISIVILIVGSGFVLGSNTKSFK